MECLVVGGSEEGRPGLDNPVERITDMSLDNPVIEKIAKLHKKAASLVELGNEEEARVFAEAVQRMLAEHELSLSDIQFEEKKKSQPIEEVWVKWQEHGLEDKQRRVAWQERLCSMIACAHSCRILVTAQGNSICVIGRKSDREVAEYVMVVLVRAAEAVATKEYYREWYKLRPLNRQGECRGYRVAFLDGFVARMKERYEEMEARIKAEHAGSSTALMRLDDARLAVQQYMNTRGGLKKSSALGKRTGLINQAGYSRARR